MEYLESRKTDAGKWKCTKSRFYAIFRAPNIAILNKF